MEGAHIVVFVLLLGIPSSSSQESTTDSRMRLQNVYPGCKSSPNQPDVSYPQCNTTFADEKNYPLPANMTECFMNSSNITLSAPKIDVYFFGSSISGRSFDCRNTSCVCKLIIDGPAGLYYLARFVQKFNNDLNIEIRDESGKRELKYDGNDALTTRNNNFVIEMEFDGARLFYIFLYLRLEAFPDCMKQLQVKCDSTSGIIETYDWGEITGYHSMDSCVALHVPENHVTMISLVGIDVKLARNKIDCADYLYIHTNGNCSGYEDERNKICQQQDLQPRVIKGNNVLSVRFKSGTHFSKSGFRLLYTFHSLSEEPWQLPDGRWNCSVSYYQSFQQHFACISKTYCSDSRDKRTCPEEGLCGGGLLTLGERCYRIIEPVGQSTWNGASETCGSYSGTLAVLNTDSKLTKIDAVLTKQQKKRKVIRNVFFIGLKILSSVAKREMYQSTWSWSDETLAVYLPLLFSKVESSYCALLEGGRFRTVSCNQKENASFICELKAAPDHSINDSEIVLSTSSSWEKYNMTTCPHNHTTYTFLACDFNANCSAANQDETIACSNEFSPPVPFFTCRNQREYVPYTLVCDFHSDCCDGSDEDFCHFPDCDSATELQCDDGKQCVDSDRECDRRKDCKDGSDESQCPESLTSASTGLVNTIEPPARVDFTGMGNFTVTRLYNTSCPETHFQCPGKGYCFPVYVRCNGVNDCPGKEDEMDCDHYTCPGFYRCRKSKICVHEKHLCDGVFQCPQHDDEWMCNFTCPDTCHCYGHAFICSGSFTADSYPELRYVDASHTGMKPEHFLNSTKLIHLRLMNCKLTTLGRLEFPNLQSLDVSYNNIQELDSSQLIWLQNLVSVSLAYNAIMSLDSLFSSTLTFPNLINMNVSGLMLQHRNGTSFNKFPNARYLNLSNSKLTKLTETGFKPMKYLRVLDLHGCPMETFFPGVFEGLNNLETVYTMNYKLCCPENLPEAMDPENCHTSKDEISSCDALLRTDVFRVFLAFYAILSLIGNAGSFIYRVCVERSVVRLGYEVFVTHLSVADFLMGVYLAIIGIADRVYYGNYRWNDLVWKHSVACKTAGFLSLVSSEVSAFLISLITLERVLVISFPHKSLRFNRMSAHAASMAVWLLGLVLALIPLLPMTSHWDFYSQSGICVPLPITRKQFDGSDYAFGVMITMNFILFLFIALGQLVIYWSIRVNTAGSSDNGRKSRDTAIARRLLAVVMTDFMCWFPIGLLGMMARSGVPISGEINVAIAIFILPFNSALNPFLYTLNVVMERRRQTANAQKSRVEGETFSSQSRTRVFDVVSESRKEESTYSKEEAFQLFKRFVEDGLLTSEQIRRHVWDIYEG